MNLSTRRHRGARRRLPMAAGVLVVAGLTAAGPALAASTPAPKTPTTTALPVPAATVDPATAIGGPALASMGVTTDLPPGTPAPPVMHDVAWLVADLDTGQVIAAKAPHARLAPASTLKTLASLVLLATIDPRKSYAAQAVDTQAGGTRVGLVPGQLYSGKQLFQALLMGSANDAAYMLSRLNGGIPATLAQMNAKAAALGALDTHAGDPSGLDSPGQSSSAYDLALIGRAAMKVAAFRTYDTTLTVPFPGNPVPRATATSAASGHGAGPTRGTPTPRSPVIVDAAGVKRETYQLSNHNTLLFNYPGTIGGKDGYTDQAHRTYISVARRGGHAYIATEMGGTDYQQWRPTARLLDWAFAYGPKAQPIGRLVEPGEVQAAAAAASASASASASESASAASASAASASAASASSSSSAALAAERSSGGQAAASLRIAPGRAVEATTLAVGGGGLAAALVLGFLGIRRARRRTSHPVRH